MGPGATLSFNGYLDHIGDSGTRVVTPISKMFWNDASDSRLKPDP
jgi:hypothetical protein